MTGVLGGSIACGAHGSPLFFIPLRDAKEFNAGAAKGAINFPIGGLEKQIGTLQKDRPLVVLGGTSACSGEAY